MSGRQGFAVDTSYVIPVLRQAATIVRSLGSVFFPTPVVGELRFGLLASSEPARQRDRIEGLLSRGKVLPIDNDTTHVYAQVRSRLKSAGTPLPENDVWIAALCVQHRLTRLTLDKHFERVEGLSLAS